MPGFDDEFWGTLDPGVERTGEGYNAAPEIQRVDVSVPIPDTDGWEATWTFAMWMRPPQPVQVTVRHPWHKAQLGLEPPADSPPGDNPGPLSVEILRKLSIAEAKKTVFEQLKHEVEALFDLELDPLELRRRPGRAGKDDYEYAVLAAKYVDLLPHPTPTKLLAEQEGLRPASVRASLNECRRRGLLTRPGKGKAGGELTDLAKEVLARGGR